MITYYIKTEAEEHMLYADELNESFKLYSNKNKPHLLFLREYLRTWAKKNIKNYQQLCFINKYGSAKEVFPKEVYLNAFTHLMSKMEKVNELYEIVINDKKYIVKRLEN